MKPVISEFSYGYALTQELVKGLGKNLKAAPVFPSLIQEGKEGGGWDVKLDRGGIPLFLQFKLSEYLVTRNALEYKKGIIDLPYYRMEIRPKSKSNQHELLLELEGLGNEVYYSTPAFHRLNELNEAYLNQDVRNRSLWVKPKDIGRFSDNKKHCLVYQLSKPYIVCSEPREIESDLSYGGFQKRIQSAFRNREKHIFTKDYLEDLSDNIEKIILKDIDLNFQKAKEAIRKNDQDKRIDFKEIDYSEDVENVGREPIKTELISRKEEIQKLNFDKLYLTNQMNVIRSKYSEKQTIQLISYYSSFYFGSQLMIVSESE